MKKAINLPALAAGGLAVAVPTTDEYRIRPGTAWVNGKKVGAEKTIVLTPGEAAYDLSLDRISLVSQPLPERWAKVDADGRS